MSPLRIVLFSQLLLAVKLSGLATGPKSAVEQAPADVAALEAAVQAKYSRPESMSEEKEQAPADVAALEAAVQAKYSRPESMSEVEAKAEVPADIAQLEAAVQAKFKPELKASDQVEAKAEVPADIAQLEAAVQAKFKPELKASDQAEAKAEVPADIAQLEAAVQAKFKPEPTANDKEEAKAEALSDAAQAKVPADIAQLEAAVQAKFRLKAESNAGEKIRAESEASSDAAQSEASSVKANKVADSNTSALKSSKQRPSWAQPKYQQPKSPRIKQVEAKTEMPSDVAQLEAAVQAKYSTETPSNGLAQESNTAAQAKETSGLKIVDTAKIERSTESSSATPQSGLKLKAEQPAEPQSNSTNATKQGGEAPKSQTVVINDRYRKHGAAMAHVESTPRRKDPNEANRRLAREAAAKERAAKLAEKRAEVEEYFHLSKTSASKMDAQPANQEQKPRGAGSALLFYIFSLAATCSLAGIAYNKYEVILRICKGQQVSQTFKAKQEDIHLMEGGGFAAPRYAQQNREHQSWSATRDILRSATSGGCHGLARRGAACPMNSYDSGV